MQLGIFDDVEAVEVGDAPPLSLRSERSLWRAAEFLVAFDISRRSWDCSIVAEGLRYDLVADVGGLRRVQVKMSRRASLRGGAGTTLAYRFGNERNPLADYVGDVDLLALVAMDRQTVLYVRPEAVRPQRLWLPAGQFTPELSDLSWSQVMSEWGVG